MSDARDLPVLGVGMILLPGLEPVLEAGQELVDVVEIEPQFRRDARTGALELQPDVFAAVQGFPQPKLVHGVGFPLGGTRLPTRAELGPFVEAIDRLAAPWASEHLSFNVFGRGGDVAGAGFLLPPVQSEESARLAAANIRAVQEFVPVPLAFETGVSYLRPRRGELSDGAFFGRIAEQADCGILLDLHNLWCNERNGRQPVLDVLAELPLERVWEVHLAGGLEQGGYWLDAHSGVVPDRLLELAEAVVPALPNLRALMFEVIQDYFLFGEVAQDELLDQLRALRKIWDARTPRPAELPGRPRVVVGAYAGGADGAAPSAPAQPAADPLPSPSIWEDALGAAVNGLAPEPDAERGELTRELAADPGAALLADLIGTVRAGYVVDVLRLSFRMIVLTRGEAAFRALLADFWRENAPRPLPVDDAHAFGEYLRRTVTDLPHLEEVAAYELASRRVLDGGPAEEVAFSCEPAKLLGSLAAIRPPECVEPGEYRVLVALP